MFGITPNLNQQYEEHWANGEMQSIETETSQGHKSIPPARGNMDYEEYLLWQAAGGVPTIIDDTPVPPSDEELAKIQFCAEYTTADICDVMQAYMAGDTKPLEALLARRQEIRTSVQAATQAKLNTVQIKVQG